ncbi:hypothetical protein [Nocardia salmonicida]|uniref:hypothetical protein n=1 Tax=Nocardia salmonicida TaxID=53431 RepID=UPI00363E2202
MTTPTLAQLAEALDVVRRHHLAQPIMPTLDVFAETIAQSAYDEKIGDAVRAAMDEHLASRFMVGGVEMANIVRTAIESTGARITTRSAPRPCSDLIGYGIARPNTAFRGGWELNTATTYDLDDLASAESVARYSNDTRPVALHLLADGGPR